jgi:hypothetical protein
MRNDESRYRGRFDRAMAIGLIVCLVHAGQAGCASGGKRAMTLEVTSSAIRPGQHIPKKHTADGADVSPPLHWSPVAGAKSYVVIVDDPDAPRGTWVHWVLYDLPADATDLAENVPRQKRLENGAKQGMNDFKKIGYYGPSPPPGKPHRYFFHVYALDRPVGAEPGLTKDQLLKAIQGHVLAEGELIGLYGR